MTLEQVLAAWGEHADKHGLILNPKPGYVRNVAKIVATNGGRCPCLPNERLHCPCDEMFEDIRRMGCCHCAVFRDPKWRYPYGVVRMA